MYVPNLISIPFVLSKILLRQASIMTNTKLWGYNSVNIQGRIMVLVHCPSSHCHLSINQVSFQDMARTHIHYEQNKWLWGDNTVNIQGRIMVLVHCPSSHCHLSINQVSFQTLLYFSRYGPGRHKNAFGEHKKCF